MTCIAGIAENGCVWIGGDSASVMGLSLTIRSDAKVFRNDGVLFGFTSSFRMGDILRYHLAVPAREPAEDLRAYMVRKFIPAVRGALKDHGWLSKDKEREEGGTFLVGVGRQLFTVADDLQVGSPADGYASVGCGQDVANGSLFASIGKPPEERIRLALLAAEHHSAGVRGPFVILTNGGS